MFNTTLCIYYRLLGASIGRDVQLEDAVLGEWDLLEIQSGATLEKNSICRPFAGERNTSMYLAPIVIGRNASVGLASVVAPGSCVPPDACIGPNSSSWELDDATEANRDLLPSRVPEPQWVLQLLATLPVVVVTQFVGLLPWLLAVVGLVMEKPPRDPSIGRVLNILNWFTAGSRADHPKRWTKKTKQQRLQVLLAAWPNMPTMYRPDFAAFRKESVAQREAGTKFRDQLF
jgi:hypothetical protein